MTLLRRRVRLLAALASALALASACGDAFRPPAAVVRGSDITTSELRESVPLFRFLTSLRQSPCGQPHRHESQQAACIRFTLGQLIEQELVKGYAQRNHVRVSHAQVLSAIAPLEQQLGGRAALSRRLAKQHVTIADLRRLAHGLLLVQAVAQAIGRRDATPAALHRRYRQEILQFTQLHAAHILVKRRSLAERIAAEATPANFASLARRYSTDSGSASNGGDLGTTQAAQFDETFARAALSLSPGEISGPVHTRFGWHVIELISARRIPFARVRAQLVSELAGDLFVSWLQRQGRGDAIDVNPRFGEFNVRTGEVFPITCTAEHPGTCPQ